MAYLKDEKVKEKKYKGVSRKEQSGRFLYFIAKHTLNGVTWSVRCETAREAALAYDKQLIRLGFPPVNILKPLNK